MTETWTTTQNLTFINLFREYPLLWDQNSPDYRHKSKKERAFEEISDRMGITKDVVKRKLHSLRTSYCAELRKMLTKKDQTPTWKYFDAMRFMFKHEDQQDFHGDPLNDINRRFVAQSFHNIESSNKYTADCDDRNMPATFDETIDDDGISHSKSNESAFRLQHSLSGETLRDEFAIFGENVGNELRSLNDYKPIQLALKCKIIRAVLEANEAVHRTSYNKYD